MTQHLTSEQPGAVRERTYSWPDPEIFAKAARELDGVDFFRQLADGTFPAPPISATLGMTLVEVDDGRVVFEVIPQEWHYNPIGTVHGGVLATIADSALGCAVHTKLKAGTGYTSMDLNIKFTRAATLETGPLTCTGRVVTLGRRAATSESEITDRSGRVIAHAIATCLIIPGS